MPSKLSLGLSCGENHPPSPVEDPKVGTRGKAEQWGRHFCCVSPLFYVRPGKAFSLVGHHYRSTPACSSSGTLGTGQVRTTRRRLEPLRVDSRKTRGRLPVKRHPNKETKGLTQRGGTGWGDKDCDCYQLLKAAISSCRCIPGYQMGTLRGEALKKVSECPLSSS